MNKLSILFIILSSAVHAQTASEDEMEIKELITSNWEMNNKSKVDVRLMSDTGHYAFNSTGGMLVHEPNPNQNKSQWDYVRLEPKHIKVISLAPGKAAIALYYCEGSMKPKGSAAVPHYLTRVSETYIKEAGRWAMKTAHYSPITGGSGTTQIGTRTEDN